MDPEGRSRNHVVESIIIPDHSNLLQAEIMRDNLNMTFDTLRKFPPPIKFIVPGYYLKEEEYRKKMQQINYLSDKELCRPLKGTQTAFVVLDSLESVKKLKKAFE
jgi:hypothetical protein